MLWRWLNKQRFDASRQASGRLPARSGHSLPYPEPAPSAGVSMQLGAPEWYLLTEKDSQGLVRLQASAKITRNRRFHAS